MIVINVLDTLKILTIFHKYFGDQCDSPAAADFFYMRESLLSYFISRNALTDGYTEGLDELEPALVKLQSMYEKIYTENQQLYQQIDSGDLIA